MKINDLSFKFNKNTQPFFSSLSFEIAPSKLHFLQGKNGSGKSTLFRILQGLIESDEIVQGTLTIDQTTYTIDQPHDRIQYGNLVRLVQQDFDTMLADQLNFIQNLALASMQRYPALESMKKVTIPAIVDHFGIDTTKPVHFLSGGQRQMLAILMVLQKPTRILLLDEPTAALDEKNSHLVMRFLHELVTTNNITVLIITHDKELVKNYAKGSFLRLEEQGDGVRALHSIAV
jgi:energy-coupling factor transporter ATP-binding protein EcfA2